MNIIKHGRYMNHGKWVIWGAGNRGIMLYQQCRNNLERNNISIYDSELAKIENLAGHLKKDELINVLQDNEVKVIIAVANDLIAENIAQELMTYGIEKNNIFRFVPEGRDDIVERVKKQGFYNGVGYSFLLDENDAKCYIMQKIESGLPFLFSRWGGTEGDTVCYDRCGLMTEKQCQVICNYSGVFPANSKIVHDFVDITTNAARTIDILCAGFWELNIEDLYRWYSPNATLCEATMIYPFFEKFAWTYSLKGKKVLVIHPFAELIKSQYAKREKLFLSPDILPEFNLVTYASVQSLGGSTEYVSWFEALDKMENDISKIDFDVALIGCGAYGMPLGAFIKDKLGKQAIHMGGSLQILFGIKGKRWEGDGYNYDKILYNDAWVRPTDDLKPSNYKSVEGGCYW